METPGVVQAMVSFEEKRGTVVFDERRVAPKDLVGIVERLGYQATFESEERPEEGPQRSLQERLGTFHALSGSL